MKRWKFYFENDIKSTDGKHSGAAARTFITIISNIIFRLLEQIPFVQKKTTFSHARARTHIYHIRYTCYQYWSNSYVMQYIN